MKESCGKHSNLFPLLLSLLFVSLIAMAGCSHSNDGSDEPIDLTPYLGTWECVGIQDGEDYQSLEDYTATKGDTYSAKLVVRDNGLAYLLENDGGAISSEVKELVSEETRPIKEDGMVVGYRPTGKYSYTGYLEISDGQLIKPSSDGRSFVFNKVSDSMGPLLRHLQLPGCTIALPIELAEEYDWEIENLGGLERMTDRDVIGLKAGPKGRVDKSSVSLYVSRDYKLTEVHPEGEETVVDGNTLYVSTESALPDNTPTKVKIQFVLPGEHSYDRYLYTITFSYNDDGEAYYGDYASSFLDNVMIGNDFTQSVETIADSEMVSTTEETQVEDGPISWRDAPMHVGEYVEVFGTVAATNYSSESDGQPTFIDIGEAYPSPNRVTIVIWGENRGNFGIAPEDMYANKYIKVEGTIYQHDGICNIEVSSPSQIVARDM